MQIVWSAGDAENVEPFGEYLHVLGDENGKS